MSKKFLTNPYFFKIFINVCTFIFSVDGKWSNWGKWSQCSKTCGQGFKVKSRKCNNPPPKGNGLNCQGKSERINRCIEKPNCGKYLFISLRSRFINKSVSAGKN